jgi:predicted short-subunit dehydrogenase-like oxidoreductase (DUF2520 family)
MDKQEEPQFNKSLLIYGAGKVGIAIGYLLSEQGYHVSGAVARSKESLENIVRFIPGAKPLSSHDKQAIKEAAASASVVLITTQDFQIQSSCEKLANNGAINNTHAVIHMSGAIGLDALESAATIGAGTAVIHPIQSFANIDLAIKRINGSYFGMTIGDNDANKTRRIALKIIEDLHGTPINIEDKNKALYHAAACVASNYLVTLIDFAQYLYKKAGVPNDLAVEVMMPLIEGTISNIKELGTEQALTGPIVRGDVPTIAHHIEQLEQLEQINKEERPAGNEQSQQECFMHADTASDIHERDVLNTYKVLGRLTVDIALRRNSINQEAATQILSLLDKTYNTV